MKEKLVAWITRLSPIQMEGLLNRLVSALILSIIMKAATTATVIYLLLR